MKLPFAFVAFLILHFYGCIAKNNTNRKNSVLHLKQTKIDSKKESLKAIQLNFKRINSITHWDQVKEIELFESTLGGFASYYFSKGKLEKIVAHYYGETFQEIDEYYLSKGELSFVFEKTYEYNRPIYWDSVKMKSFNDTEMFDFEKSTRCEQRNYFHTGKLFQQLKSDHGGKSCTQKQLKIEETRIETAFNDLLKKNGNK